MACHHERGREAVPVSGTGPQRCRTGCWEVALDPRGLCRTPASSGRRWRNRFSRGSMGQRPPGVGPMQHLPPQKLRKTFQPKGRECTVGS